MKFSTITTIAALLTTAVGFPTSSPEENKLETRTNVKRTIQLNRGVNILKSYAATVGLSGGKVATTGAIRATGAIAQIFTETNMGEHVALAAYEHLKQTMLTTNTVSDVVNAVLHHGIWKVSYAVYGSRPVFTVSAAILLDTTTATFHLSQADFNLLTDTIYDYWRGHNYLVNQNWVQSGNAFEGFPLSRREITARDLDLTSKQICHRPTDIRKFFGNDVPVMTTTLTGC